MHRMHRIFSGDGWLVFPDILKSARDHRRSQRLLQQPPVLIILCILCIDVQFIVLLDGSAQSDKREFPKGDRPAFREVARRIPPPHHRDDTAPRERGRIAVPSGLRCCSRPPCRRAKQRQGARWRRWPYHESHQRAEAFWQLSLKEVHQSSLSNDPPRPPTYLNAPGGWNRFIVKHG